MDDENLISSILTFLPVVITPLLLFFLNRIKNRTEQNQISKYIHRLELLEKLRDFNSKLPDNKSLLQENIFESEITEIQNFLRPQLSEDEKKLLINFKRINKFRRLMLLYKSASFKVSLLRFFFYYSIFGVVLNLSEVVNAYDPTPNIILSIIYFILLFVFSYYANMLQIRDLLRKTEPNIV